jgi:serine phosphatase RsbU (regulator of sigma subunit)
MTLSRQSAANAHEHELAVVLDSLAEAVTVVDLDARTVFANPAAVELLRAAGAEELYAAEASDLMRRFAVYDEDGHPVALEELPGSRILAGEQAVKPLLVRNVVKATGEERWLLNKASAIHDDDGHVMRVVNVIEDVTEAMRADRAHRLLAEASEALATSLDFEQTLQRIADMAVPALADWCEVHLRGHGGRLEGVAVADVDPERVRLAHELRDRFLLGHDEPQATPGVMVVPLTAAGETLGALTFVNADPVRRFSRADLDLARELGRRAATAVVNSRLFTRRSAIARTLEQSLLPPELPELGAWSAAALYRPAGELNSVGGDFYDLFRGPGGWFVLIGDMVGQGVEAAAGTALARFTLRTAAELTGDPAQAVVHLNATLRSQRHLPICTVVCALLEELDSEAAITLACGGHPPPLLLRGGEVVALGDAGTMVGAFEGERWSTATIALREGDVIVFYTDGVLDAVGECDRFGEARLRAAVAAAAGAGAAGVVTALDAELKAFETGLRRDDTTILAVQYAGLGG